MDLKAKLFTTISLMCLTIAMLMVGVWAVKTADFKVGGNISFTATGINATISQGVLSDTGSWVTPSDAGIKMKEIVLNTDKTQSQIESEFASWQGVDLMFNEKGEDVTISFSITNNSTNKEYVSVSVGINVGTIVNATASINQSTVEIAPNTTENFVITFSVVDPTSNASLTGFEVVFDMSLSQKTTLSSSDTALGQVEYTLEDNILKYTVAKETGAKFVGLRNTSTGKYEFINTLVGGGEMQLVMDLMNSGISGIEETILNFSNDFVDYSAVYNNADAYAYICQMISNVGEQWAYFDYQCYGLADVLKNIYYKEETFSFEMEDVSTEYEAVFTSETGTEGSENGYTYVKFEDAGISLINNFVLPTGASGNVQIPQTLGGKTVVGNLCVEALFMGNQVFSGNITSVVISETIVNLAYAFAGLSSLQSATITNGVVNIGMGTFTESGIENITLPESVRKIGNTCFSNCANLSSVTMSNGLKIIENYAFNECANLTKIEVPNSVTIIGSNAFRMCPKLEDVTIGDNVQTIGIEAFHNCTALKEIEIPNSVQIIGEDAFSHCDSLTSVTMGNGVIVIEDGAFGVCGVLSSIKIPASVTYIGPAAFYYNLQMQCVIIDNEIISEELTAEYGSGYLVAYATTVYIKTEIVTAGKVGSYVTNSFTTVETISSGEYAGYTKYSRSL